jgi:hypothetical protein
MAPLVPIKSDEPVAPSLERQYAVVGKHSARCLREKHDDFMHGMDHCAVGSDSNHCDCTAHYVEIRF